MNIIEFVRVIQIASSIATRIQIRVHFVCQTSAPASTNIIIPIVELIRARATTAELLFEIQKKRRVRAEKLLLAALTNIFWPRAVHTFVLAFKSVDQLHLILDALLQNGPPALQIVHFSLVELELLHRPVDVIQQIFSLLFVPFLLTAVLTVGSETSGEQTGAAVRTV
jgi:hypothetical protein